MCGYLLYDLSWHMQNFNFNFKLQVRLGAQLELVFEVELILVSGSWSFHGNLTLFNPEHSAH
jgi:hypothetical protein